MSILNEIVRCEKCTETLSVADVARGKTVCSRCKAEDKRLKTREYQRKYRERKAEVDPNCGRDRIRKYREENPHITFYTTSRYLAKKAGVFSDLTQEDALDIYELPDTCAYCGKERLSDGGKRAIHYDHIIPMSQGGVNSRWNITKVCASCNSSKGDRSLIDFYERTPEFTSDRYSVVIEEVARLSGLSTGRVEMLLAQSNEFEQAHERQRRKLTEMTRLFTA